MEEPMNLVVFGATGLTGRHVVTQALAAGHDVVALVREPARLTPTHPRLGVLQGHATNPSDVERCVRGADAVIHCLGIGGRGDGKRTTLISDSVRITLGAMEQHNVARIVCMSNVGVGGSGTWIANQIVIPLFLRWLVPILEDKERMEALLRASRAEWVAVRLPSIIEGPIAPLRISADGRGIGRTVTAASVAQFLLTHVTSAELLRSTPSISQ
jgi:uncharacterized protein YbjT (DUF2867 family)